MQFADKIVVVASVSTDRGDARTLEHAKTLVHLGTVCARDFAKHGAHVVAIDTSQSALDALAAVVRSEGGKISTIQADPSEPADLARAADYCKAQFGRVNVLLTCHHDTELQSIEASSSESWVRVIHFDLLGPLFASKAFLPLMKHAPDAAIVHMGSIDGTLGNPQVPSYSAAKGGMVPLTHVMAEEFAAYGIRVNAVARAMAKDPSAPLNPMFASFMEHTPLGRPATPSEVVAAARFLASAEASYITGVILPVDGGRSCITPGTRPKRQ